MKFVRLRLAVAIFLLASGGAALAADWGHLYGYVDWTNDYRFYGMSESNRQPAVQGGLHWAAPDNFYAGLFASAVDFRDFRGTNYELDLYGGRHFIFGNDDLNLEALYALYPDTSGHPTYAAPGVILAGYNFFEASAELTHKFGGLALGGKAVAEPRPNSHGGFLWSLNGEANYTINDWLSASANFGHQWARRSTQTFWNIGATATWRQQWVLDLRYYGSGTGRADCFGTNWCKPAAVAKITYQFAVL